MTRYLTALMVQMKEANVTSRVLHIQCLTVLMSAIQPLKDHIVHVLRDSILIFLMGAVKVCFSISFVFRSSGPLTLKPIHWYASDTDECNDRNPCDQACSNTFGSYKCSCTKGYALENGHECKSTGDILLLTKIDLMNKGCTKWNTGYIIVCIACI